MSVTTLHENRKQTTEVIHHRALPANTCPRKITGLLSITSTPNVDKFATVINHEKDMLSELELNIFAHVGKLSLTCDRIHLEELLNGKLQLEPWSVMWFPL
ncbi:hypothetical protein CBL_04924 [Carabus blaptoides fortunei]